MEEDELLDLVNGKDEVIGTVYRSQYKELLLKRLGYIRSVEMYIQNDEGKLWVPTRTAHKQIAPSGLDYSVGGHVSSGEEYIDSAIRETKEELGLKLSREDFKFIHKFAPIKLPFFRSFYIYYSNTAPSFNPDDFTHGEWLSLKEILERLDSGVPAKDSLRETIEFLITHNQ